MTKPNESINSFKYDDGYGDNGTTTGLTKREYLAAAALQGLLPRVTHEFGRPAENIYAERAVRYADALIEALNKNTNDTRTDDTRGND
jgi:hypothetical protein